MRYLFITKTSIKENDAGRIWIDRDIMPQVIISADNLKKALEKYAERAAEEAFISISGNALKNRQPMYIDTISGAEQVGYVITGSTEIDNGDKWTRHYIDLWVDILEITTPAF